MCLASSPRLLDMLLSEFNRPLKNVPTRTPCLPSPFYRFGIKFMRDAKESVTRGACDVHPLNRSGLCFLHFLFQIAKMVTMKTQANEYKRASTGDMAHLLVGFDEPENFGLRELLAPAQMPVEVIQFGGNIDTPAGRKPFAGVRL